MNTALTFDDISPAYLSVEKLTKLVNFLNRINITATLFVIPNSHGTYPLSKEYANVLNFAKDAGHEIALHGYEHRNLINLGGTALEHEFGTLLPIPWPSYKKQKLLIRKGMKCLREKFGEYPVGFRAPSYLYNKITIQVLKDLGFSYDSSQTVFKPAHGCGFRIKTGYAPNPILREDLLEVPVTGDYTYNDDERNALERAIRDFRWVRDLDGVFVVNTHVHNLVAEQDFLKKLVEKISPFTNFISLKALVNTHNVF